MEIKALFPTPLIICELSPEVADCGALKRVVLERAAMEKGVQESNQGGWQSGDDFLEWSGPVGRKLIQAIVDVVDGHTGVLDGVSLRRAPIRWKINAWANVSKYGHSNAFHYHQGGYWATVFYVDDGGSADDNALGGAIDFIDPRGPCPMMQAPLIRMLIPGCANAGQGERFYPKTGRLMVFPAWLGHAATPYSGASERISIAVNLTA